MCDALTGKRRTVEYVEADVSAAGASQSIERARDSAYHVFPVVHHDERDAGRGSR